MKLFLFSTLAILTYILFKPVTPFLSIENQYQPYVTGFERESVRQNHPVHIVNLIIKTENYIGENIIAQCRQNHVSTPEIAVSRQEWVKADEYEREMILFHEMGHCVLHRYHTAKKDVDGIATSIMGPYILPSTLYKNRRELYMKELFNYFADST